jgi:hypothetical protein
MGEEAGGVTSLEEGTTADETPVSFGWSVSRAGKPVVVKTVDGPSRRELVTDVATIGSRESNEVTGTSASVEGLSRTVASGS